MRKKHIPQRTCVECRKVLSKRELIRIVRTPEGDVRVDETGKVSGRGVYLCRARKCWTGALAKGRIGYALKIQLSPEQETTLREYAANLPEEAEGA
ncbi:MAG: YlxR family protein [Chloroflexi bacterium]|nr:YlxR family protein [Chloroflexota bacterium]